ncbi:MAG: LTA synthase family protein [Pedobacter sp.]|nr:MAG: LTA synthase family protein [Pedobacter sp.]
MLKNFLFFGRLLLFLLLFFFADRLAFLLINAKALSVVPLHEVAATFYHSLLLDFSMAAYLMVIPVLSFIFWLLSGRKLIELKWLSLYAKTLVIIFSILSVANFNIYREWGSKINAKALEVAFTTPNEALASSVSSPIALSVSLLVLLIAIGFVLQRYVIERKLIFAKINIWLRLIIAIAILGINFLLIRGGLSGSPINQSMAYFSKYQILNVAAVNTEWNLLSSVIAASKTKGNPYSYLPKDEAEQLVNNLYHVDKDTTISILNNKKPNVVLIIMESFTADLTKHQGNLDDVTPGFDSLINHGLLFENIYSTGNRTDKGFMGTLAGFPTLAAVNIVKWPEKTNKLPSISRSLARFGYHNSFYYGGESEFDNYKAFLLSHDVQRLVDRNDFKTGAVTSWGQFDGAVFKRQLEEINVEKQPFFSTILTLTNHEPFAVPGRYRFGTEDNVAKFKSTAYYTDSCITAYLKEAKKQPWFSNTLFVFIADHGHVYPKNRSDVFIPERYHIPFLLYGEVLKNEFKGKTMDVVGSQSDVPSTILSQLGIAHDEFRWSKDLMNPYVKPFAFFSWDNGMGFIDNQQCATFDNVGKMVLYNSKPTDELQTKYTLDHAKSYLQSVYEHFLNL